jgi:hypothetical protein
VLLVEPPEVEQLTLGLRDKDRYRDMGMRVSARCLWTTRLYEA